LSRRGLCDELITRPEESYRLCCAVVCDLETSTMGAPYIYDISRLRVKGKDYIDEKGDSRREGSLLMASGRHFNSRPIHAQAS